MAEQQEITLKATVDPVLVRMAGRALLATGQTVRDAADVIEREQREGARLRAALRDIRHYVILAEAALPEAAIAQIQGMIDRALAPE